MSSPSLSPPPEHECHPYSSSSLRWSSLAIAAAAWISVTPGGFIINSCVSTTIAKNISLFSLAKPSTVSSPSSSTFTRATDTWRGNVHIQSFLGFSYCRSWGNGTAFPESSRFCAEICRHALWESSVGFFFCHPGPDRTWTGSRERSKLQNSSPGSS